MLRLNGNHVKPTIFPDGTSQVWKVLDGNSAAVIDWDFENESEVFHLLQLIHLINSTGRKPDLVANFFPYSRQDKDVSDGSCFALNTLLELLDGKVDSIVTFDVHNPGPFIVRHFHLLDKTPFSCIADAITACMATHVCFPDQGAWLRYRDLGSMPSIVLRKHRVQETGEIDGMAIVQCDAGDVKSILIVDDICDGGRTFIESASVLKKRFPVVDLNLYVSHGIFSKGVGILHDAGFSRIFTRKGIHSERQSNTAN